MGMIDVQSIVPQVKHNCNISDARFWGYYSPCGLLLRMRDLYRIEQAMQPWDAVNHEQIKQWIDAREQLWYDMEDLEFRDITLNGQTYDPFDIEAINAALSPHGYVYSAGYGNRLKPVFMFAELAGRSSVDTFDVYISGRELARDLSIAPAMTRGNTIFARQETTGLFFWDKFEEMKAMKSPGTLERAFLEYGIERDADSAMPSRELQDRFACMVREEITTAIYHERGEATESREFGPWWKELLMSISNSRAEFFVRSLKDVLADTCNSGMLAHIINKEKTGSLGFYVSLLGGYRKIVFPDLSHVYGAFSQTGDWTVIEKARTAGYDRALKYIQQLRELYDKGGLTKEIIEERFITDGV